MRRLALLTLPLAAGCAGAGAPLAVDTPLGSIRAGAPPRAEADGCRLRVDGALDVVLPPGASWMVCPSEPETPAPEPETPAAAPGEIDELAALKEAEGFRPEPECEAGRVHVAYGHAVAEAEGELLLECDWADAVADAADVVGEPAWSSMAQARRDALAEIVFMGGRAGFREHVRTLDAVRAGDWAAAADEIEFRSRLLPEARRARLARWMRAGERSE